METSKIFVFKINLGVTKSIAVCFRADSCVKKYSLEYMAK